MAIVAIFWMGLAFLLSFERTNASERAIQQGSSLARLFEENTIRLFKGVDQTLLLLRRAAASALIIHPTSPRNAPPAAAPVVFAAVSLASAARSRSAWVGPVFRRTLVRPALTRKVKGLR